MLTAREEEFITYWETHRAAHSSVLSKLVRGLPMAVMFGLPIILSILIVNIYFPDWYAKLSNTNSGSFIAVIVAVIIAILFFSYFRMHFKWEMNEQLFKELIHKRHKSQAANPQENISS